MNTNLINIENVAEDMPTRLKNLRRNCHLTQIELAKKVGISRSTIQKHENGSANVSMKMLEWYSNFYDVSIEFLVYGTCEPASYRFNELPSDFIELCNEIYPVYQKNQSFVKNYLGLLLKL